MYRRIVSKGKAEYFYLHVTLEFEDFEDVPVDAIKFKTIIVDALQGLFGLAGASIPADILKFHQPKRSAVLRVPSSGFVKLWSSLTLLGTCMGRRCAFRVHQVTPHLMALSANSREWQL
ncbi:ribonuclease P protein subunit p14 [Lingula anatina]|uniref:Ribonuclease P protein subunit p14 n=1 Tax=Lingula anatina TaxID=7574 RepID=A0A1S3JCZ2_LINAN|nr:ribonuclease P protein subunit p14 [Lingula anatina]|eukprot:XP_013408272.1 ribonuclease P protein subunit p14 [Lingula anatina]